MQEKDYVISLRPEEELDDRLRINVVTELGRVVDFVAQYGTVIAGRIDPVVRYDGSHQVGHRDLLDRHGATIRKDILPGNPSLAESLNQGKQDIVDNWLVYREQLIIREAIEKDLS